MENMIDFENEDLTNPVILSDVMTSLSNVDFKKHFRLTKTSIEMLIIEIGDAVIPSNPRRPAIPVKTAILLFLWTITHDESFREIAKRFEVGTGHTHRIFVTMCTALAEKRDKYISWPVGESADQAIFEFQHLGNLHNFPDVIGAVDNIDVPIPGPSSDSSYYNKYGFCSIILQGICNAKMEFTDVCVDSPGSSISSWTDSPIYKMLTENNLILQDVYVVADSNFEPDNFLLVPFSKNGREITEDEKIFNAVLKEKYNVIKQAFRLLKHNFKRLHFVKIQKIEYAKALIISACILHNISLTQDNDHAPLTEAVNDKDDAYIDDEDFDQEEAVMYLIDENDEEAMALYGNKDGSNIFVVHGNDDDEN